MLQAVAQVLVAMGPPHVGNIDLGQRNGLGHFRRFLETDLEVLIDETASRLGPEVGQHVLQLVVLQHDHAPSLVAMLATHQRIARCVCVCLDEGGSCRRIVACGELHDILHHTEIGDHNFKLVIDTLYLLTAIPLLPIECLLQVRNFQSQILDPARSLEYMTMRHVRLRIELCHSIPGLIHREQLSEVEHLTILQFDLHFGLGL
mmetsp:Transcript_11062/g.29486  ORF Transcript_11062/g.29486 Transcript_11062/m.29486 type:complete len:204 (-) Transcript_11062:290-901(-)